MKCQFVVGQKVVCIVQGIWHSASGYTYVGAPLPVKDGIYTITSIEVCFDNVYLTFAEVPPAQGFAHQHFRPVQERKTDISVFTALLNPAGKKQREDA